MAIICNILAVKIQASHFWLFRSRNNMDSGMANFAVNLDSSSDGSQFL